MISIIIKTKIFLCLFALLLLLSLTSVVYAEDYNEVNLLELPRALGERLGVGEFAGGIICSSILLMMSVLPTTLINRSRKGGGGPMAEIVVGITILSLCVAITWLPFWILFIVILLIVVALSGKFGDWIGGGRG